MVMESTPRDIYLRFFSLMKQFPHLMAARLSQIDYSREMAFVAIAPPGSADAGDILGVARMIADPNNERAEFAVMVRSDWHGRALGFKLMQTLITCADRRGIGTLYGDGGRTLAAARSSPARGRPSRPGLERAGEGALVGEAEDLGDVGDPLVLHEEALRRLEWLCRRGPNR